jgi:TRAP-type mannitol/chloroaromatic compound transport system permease large subunit
VIEIIAQNMAPIMFVSLIVFLLLGYPVAFSLAANGLVFFFIAVELAPYANGEITLSWSFLYALPDRLWGVMSNETLLAIPFFTFMGLVLERSGMAEELLDTAGKLFGPVRGGVAYAVIFVGALLAATTGVVAASVIAMGLISLPIMLRYGYDRRIATGVIAASGTLAQIIPPSLVLIIMADQLGRSVGDMYKGAIIPGLILTLLYDGYIFLMTMLYPKSAPALPPEARSFGEGAPYAPVMRAVTFPLVLVLWGMILLFSPELAISMLEQYAPPVAALFKATFSSQGAVIFAFLGLLAVLYFGYYLFMRIIPKPLPQALAAVFALAAVYFLYQAGTDLAARIGELPSLADGFLGFLWGLIVWIAHDWTWYLAIFGLAMGAQALISAPSVPVAKAVAKIVNDLLPPLILIFLVLGTIFQGIATPTEGGAMGAVGAVVLALVKRRLTLDLTRQATESATRLSAFVLFILVGARVFSLTFYGVNGHVWVEHLLTSLPGGQVGFLIMVNVMVFLLAFFLDFFELAFIVVPLLAPAAAALGIDLIWFGVLLGINMQTSFMHPPFGFALFYLRSVAARVPYVDKVTGNMTAPVTTGQIYWGAVPFVIIQVIMVALAILFPQMVMHYKGTPAAAPSGGLVIQAPAGGGLQGLPSLGGGGLQGLPNQQPSVGTQPQPGGTGLPGLQLQPLGLPQQGQPQTSN